MMKRSSSSGPRFDSNRKGGPMVKFYFSTTKSTYYYVCPVITYANYTYTIDGLETSKKRIGYGYVSDTSGYDSLARNY